MTRFLAPFGALAALSSAAHGQLINDTFSTNPSNPNDVGWYYAAPAPAAFSAASGALQYTNANNTTNNISVFKQFTPTQLAVGETLQVAFTFTAFATQPTSVTNNHLRIGLFDTADSFSANQAASPWSTSNEGYFMAIGGGSATATSNFHYRAGNTNLLTTTGAVALGTADTFAQFSYASSTNVTFSITRSASNEVRLNGSYTQGVNTYAFTQDTVTGTTNYADIFDTLYIGYGLNVNGRGFTLDNVTLAVSSIPEPSTFAALTGVIALGLCATRRRPRL